MDGCCFHCKIDVLRFAFDARGIRLTVFLGGQSVAVPPHCAAARNGSGRGVANLPALESPDSPKDRSEFALPQSLADHLAWDAPQALRPPPSPPSALLPPLPRPRSRLT